jgi:hypothetical protein
METESVVNGLQIGFGLRGLADVQGSPHSITHNPDSIN